VDAQTPTNGVCPVVKNSILPTPQWGKRLQGSKTPMKRHLIGGPSTVNEAKHVTMLQLQQVLQHAFQARERQF
jgi:hypothetical protein